MTQTRRVVAHDDAVQAAERLFHDGHDVDMDRLAERLCISRATLYRVVGNRDRLLGDVCWRQGSRLMQRLLPRDVGAGAPALAALAHAFNTALVGYAPLRAFVRDQPETAFRVLFMAEAGVHARFVAAWEALFRECRDATGWKPPMDVADLAFVFVRVGESLLYADLLAGRTPDLALARHLQTLVLTAPVAAT